MSGPLEFTFKGQSAFVLGAPVSHSHGSFRRAVRALSERRVQASEAGWSGRRAQGPSCTFGIELRYSTFENAPPDSTAVAATVANPNAPRLCSLRMFVNVFGREKRSGGGVLQSRVYRAHPCPYFGARLREHLRVVRQPAKVSVRE